MHDVLAATLLAVPVAGWLHLRLMRHRPTPAKDRGAGTVWVEFSADASAFTDAMVRMGEAGRVAAARVRAVLGMPKRCWCGWDPSGGRGHDHVARMAAGGRRDPRTGPSLSASGRLIADAFDVPHAVAAAAVAPWQQAVYGQFRSVGSWDHDTAHDLDREPPRRRAPWGQPAADDLHALFAAQHDLLVVDEGELEGGLAVPGGCWRTVDDGGRYVPCGRGDVNGLGLCPDHHDDLAEEH